MKIISKKLGSLEASISSWAAAEEKFDDTQSQLQTYMCFKEQCTSHWFCYIALSLTFHACSYGTQLRLYNKFIDFKQQLDDSLKALSSNYTKGVLEKFTPKT